MIVTDVTEHGKSKYKVYVDCEFAFVLYKGELHKYKIKKGQEIAPEVYRELTEQILPKRAKLRAMNLLTKRPYTEQQLRQKLQEGLYEQRYIDIALEYVMSFGYVDDEAYARDYIAYHIASDSCKNIEKKLLQKGIDSKMIRRILSETQEREQKDYETEQIRALFEKKYKGIIPDDPGEKNKMLGFFLRKGYSVLSVKNALEDLSLDSLYN
nr:regulatory protein RecX [Lachnospiraceae bacterium]